VPGREQEFPLGLKAVAPEQELPVLDEEPVPVLQQVLLYEPAVSELATQLGDVAQELDPPEPSVNGQPGYRAHPTYGFQPRDYRRCAQTVKVLITTTSE
jgi:hypothetical protein